MTEKTLFKFEKKMTKSEIAEHLDQISEKLKSGEPITFNSDKSIELNPSETSEFEIKVEEEGSETSLELEIEWDQNKSDSSDLNIS